MNITKFNEKFNRVEGNIYTVEEVVTPIDGVYEAPLIHDNASNINVYTGSKLTGDKINTYSLSTPSLTPWETVITIYSNEPKLYITYETTGDTVEADDINNLQDSVNETQEALNNEITRATNRENTIESNLNKEIDRAKQKENEIANNLSEEIARAEESENIITGNLETEVSRARNAESIITSNLDKEINRSMGKESEIEENLTNEVTRAKNSESTLATNLNKEVERAKDEEKTLTDNLNKEINRAKEKESKIESDINANRANWNDAYNKRHTHANKSIIDGITQALVTNWNSAFSHISDNIKHITAGERSNWNDANNKKHEHSNKSILDTITSALISNWNSAFTHISDAVKHITNAERTLWNTVSNKADISHTHDSMSNILLTDKTIDLNSLNCSTGSPHLAFYRCTTTGGSSNISNKPTGDGAFSLKVESIRYISSNDYITKQTFISVITNITYERFCTTGTWGNWKAVYTTGNKPTKADVGLGNVDNTSDLNKPISTATQTALNGKANTSHTHDDRYYTESECNSKFATKDELSGSGNGDMLKSVYDTNNNGVVDKAEKLATTRNIALNGTVTGNANFDGSGNITINTAPRDFRINDTFVTNFRQQVKGDTNSGTFLSTIRQDSANVSYSPQYGSGIGFGVSDTHGYLYMNYNNAAAYIGGGNQGKLLWIKQLAFMDSNVSSATKATQDSDGKQINTTYVKKGMTWNQLEGI